MDTPHASSGSGLTDALAEHFGFEEFRPGQRPVIEAILEGRHAVAVMPTGAGKSLCYQLPALCLAGCTIVVSPLISLMKDQVDALRARGIAAAYVNSSMGPWEQRAALEAAANGELKLLYLAPERFRFEGARAAIRRIPLDLFVIDEAHCISKWGHDFRPDYMMLGDVIRDLQAPRVAAFTATATPKVRQDIIDRLGVPDPFVTVSGFLRENLHFSVVPVRRMVEKDDHLISLLRDVDGSAVVYCATRKKCEAVRATLARHRIDAAVYHAGLDDSTRHAVHDAYAADKVKVVVATNAFGMGIDKSDVRAVIHYEIPGSLEAYYQEVGRAGRDGDLSRCVLLFTYADTRIHEFFISKGGDNLSPERRAAWAEEEGRKLKTMVRYAYADVCRHAEVLRYFGERLVIGPEGCGACDVCTGETGVPGLKTSDMSGPRGSSRSSRSDGASRKQRVKRSAPPQRDLTDGEVTVVQKVLSGVARSRGRLTTGDLSRILKGSSRPEILADPLAESKSFAILKRVSHPMLVALLKALERAGCITGRRPRITPLGADVMWRRADIQLAMPPFEERRSRSELTASSSLAAPLEPEQKELLKACKSARSEAARERDVPAYVIVSNKVLERLVTSPPAPTRDAWLAVKGIGPASVDPLREIFGDLLVDVAPDRTQARAAAVVETTIDVDFSVL